MFSWVAEYWEDGSLVEYDCGDYRWSDLPEHGVIRVRIHMKGQVGYGNPSKQYVHGLQGHDRYYLRKNTDDSSVMFGAWSDDPQLGGSMYKWAPTEWYGPVDMPDSMDDSDIKLGVLVPDDIARGLGLL